MGDGFFSRTDRGESKVSSNIQDVDQLSAVQFCRALAIESSKSRLPKVFRDYVERAHFVYREAVRSILKAGLPEGSHPDTQTIFGLFTMATQWSQVAQAFEGCTPKSPAVSERDALLAHLEASFRELPGTPPPVLEPTAARPPPPPREIQPLFAESHSGTQQQGEISSSSLFSLSPLLLPLHPFIPLCLFVAQFLAIYFLLPQDELAKEAQNLDSTLLSHMVLDFVAHGLQLYMEGVTERDMEAASTMLVDVRKRFLGPPWSSPLHPPRW